jgi:protein phosphatase
MTLTFPELSLVVLIGISGSGKSSFAGKHFLPTEVISSDFCRGLVSDDQNDQTATRDAFEVLHYIAARRLARGKLTVIDATNVQPEARQPLVALAREYHCLPVAVVLDVPESLCRERNRERPDRNFGSHILRQQRQNLRRNIRNLRYEGFRHIFVLRSQEEVDQVEIVRTPLWNDRRSEHGPFDMIGDVHGCFDELCELLGQLGYQVDAEHLTAHHPDNRKAIFLGDIVDRGPHIVPTLKLVMNMVASGDALCVPGNHDMKLMRALYGKQVQIAHGLAESLNQLAGESDDFRAETVAFLDALVSHYVLDNWRLVVAHAGMLEEMQGRGSGKVRDFALYGQTTGETDEYGLPVRHDWAQEYRGSAMVVYGHTPVLETEWVNRTINIDTGCVFGGKLTALRYPEKELVSVPAKQVYYQSAKPLTQPRTASRAEDDMLDIDDILGKRIISTSLHHGVTIREENARAALEVMSRFAADPHWLIYLPPTMSPAQTTHKPGLLEHLHEAFAHYHKQGISQVVCEEKHMGSRAVVIVCKNAAVAQQRFGAQPDERGICYTRTGRRFFDDQAIERQLLDHVDAALTRAGLWEELQTDWICLDCELMPWSAKAQDLLRNQYAAVGIAGEVGLQETIAVLEQTALRDTGITGMVDVYRQRLELVQQYRTAYRHYCWPVNSVTDLRLAPFHLLATEGHMYTDKPHTWHMEILARLSSPADPLLMATPYRAVNLDDQQQVEDAIGWWEQLTAQGGEGMVVKPQDFIARGEKGLVQPAVKCRGREYLRIIYGPEYTLPEHLARLRSRGLSVKRSLAMREFALGIEALERFVRREPLYRVHECVFGVLALESEPVDPRL